MKTQQQFARTFLDKRVLSAWRQQVAQAAQDDGVKQRLLQREAELLPGFAAYYTKLRALPRRVRRDLQRRVRPAHRALIQGTRPTRMQSLAGVALLLALGQTPALAATINVNTNTPDINADGQCSLIEAIVNANAGAATHADCTAGDPGADTVTLQPNSTHTLTGVNNAAFGNNGLPVIASTITVAGNSSTITRGSSAPAFRIFMVNSAGNLTLQDTTVSRGVTSVSGPSGYGGGIFVYGGALTLTNSTIAGNSSSDYGGGLFNNSTVTLLNSTISGNSAAGGGGGIANRGGTSTLNDSTVSGNSSAVRGGGISNYFSDVTLNNSTISSNTAIGTGGGVDIRRGGTFSLTNSTISGNSAAQSGGIEAGFISTVNLTRSLVSGNIAPTGAELRAYYRATVNANSFNLFGHSGLNNGQAFSGFTPGANDITATSDGTMPTALGNILDTTLANNGGPTRTHALVTGSPAVDAAGSGCPPPNADQRGVNRPQGAACDIGAFELAGAPPADSTDLSVTKADSPDPVTGGDDLTYTLTVTNNGPDDATGVTLTDDLPDSVLFVSASAGCTELSGMVTCNIGSLTNGSNAIREIVVSTTTDGTITNTASVTGAEADPDAGNNTANEDTVVNVAAVPMADLAVAKSDSPDPVTVGSNLSYTITTTNNGPDPATGVTLTDTLPASVTFVSASTGCAQSGGVVNCTIGNLANGANAPVQITVTPNSQGTISNMAQVSGNENDPATANNTATEQTTVNAVSAVTCAGRTPTRVGTAGNNTINGTPRADIIQALGGNDLVRGKGGNDVICGGEGNDRLRAAGGNDQVFGDAGNDQLFGEAGADSLDGGVNVDRCNGGSPTTGDTAANCETVSNVP